MGLDVEAKDDPAPHLGVVVSESDAGITFASVLRDRPAGRAGVTGGDGLLAIDGTAVARGELAAALRAHSPGDLVEVTVRRGPRLPTRPVVLGDPRPVVRLVRSADADAHAHEAFRRWPNHDLADVAATGGTRD